MNEHVATPDGGDAYHVMLAGGQLRVLSLDELDEAFNAGDIDERTFVLSPGTTEWTRLGELLGLDGEGDAAAAAPVAAPQVQHVAPVMSAPVMGMGMSAPVMAARPQPHVAPAMVMTPSSPPPSSMIPPATISVAPPVMSTRPVAFDLDLDVPDDALKPKRRAPVFVAVALFAIAGAGLVAFKNMPAQSEAAATAAAAAAAVPAAPPPQSATPTPTYAATQTAAIDDKPKLTDDQKKALLDADKTRAAKAAANRAAKAERAPHHHSGGKHSKEKVFHNGGSAYDPLNASL
jgi:hypothetical protein